MLLNQPCILLLTTVYLNISWVISTAPTIYNPCSALTQSSSTQEFERAYKYCRSVHSRAISDPTSEIHDLCPNSINPGCTSEQKTEQGTKYMCTVEVRSTDTSSATPGQSRNQYDLLHCVPDISKWKQPDKSQEELVNFEKMEDKFSSGCFPTRWRFIMRRGFRTSTENAAAYSTQGKRPHMEDRFNIKEDIAESTPKVLFFAVFDGHGGEFAVEYTRENLWKNLRDKIQSVQKLNGQSTSGLDNFTANKQDISVSNDQAYVMGGGKINYGPLLHDVILATDKALLAEAEEADDISGTTAVMALIDGSRLFIANVGDSRAVMCDALGNAIQLSIDHKPTDENEKKSIEEAGGYVAYNGGKMRVCGYLAMSRALGNAHLKQDNCLTARPDVFSFDLFHHQPQFIILASDGLWDVFSNEEAVAFIAGRVDRNQHFGAKSLAIYAYFRGSKDNITVMVINLKNRTWATSREIRASRESSKKTYGKRTVEAP